MGRFLKADVFSGKSGNEYPQIQLGHKNQVEDSNLEIGEKTHSHFSKLSEQCQKDFLLGVWEFYKVCTSYLVKSPLANIIIRCCKALQRLLQQEDFTLKGIPILGKRLLVSVDINSLSDEWKLYQLDDISLEFFKTKDFNENVEEILLKERVGHYWRKIELMKNAVGDLKYPLIIKVVKVALSLAHGNAEVERGLSENAKNVTKDWVLLSEASVDAIPSTKDGLKSVNNQPHTVPITKEFIQFGRRVHCAYNSWQEVEKQVLDETERKKKEDEEQRLMRKKEEEVFLKEKESLNTKYAIDDVHVMIHKISQFFIVIFQS